MGTIRIHLKLDHMVHVDRATTLYNGSCPVCGTEIRHYQRRCASRGVALGWSDITEDRQMLDALGLTLDEAKKRLHVLTPDGTVHIGVDAFIILWDEVPGYRWLSRFAALPGINFCARAVYDHVLAPALFAWNKRRGR